MSLLCLCIVLIFFPAASAPSAQAARPAPIHHINFDLKTETYNQLYGKLRVLLERTSKPEYDPTNVKQKYVLGQQRQNFRGEPPGWIYIHIDGQAEEDKVTLAIAIDDLYLIGFRNATNYWYKFGGGFECLPGAIVLPIEENYGEMIDGGHSNLWKVPLGKQSAIQATKQLARYDSLPTSKPQMKDGLVRFIVMICEAMRFKVIRETFWGTKWEKETFISKKEAKYVVDWGSLSTLLIMWDKSKTKQWGVTKGKYKSLAGRVERNSDVKGMLDAWKIIDFLLRPNDI